MEEDIKKTVQALREGGVILYPTDTVWGLGCDATNEEAVNRVFEIKRRADSRSMLVLLADIKELGNYVERIPEIAYRLMEAADKPLTVIYPRARNLAPNLIAADGSIGIRVTAEAFTRRLLAAFGKPVVSTSANISGEPAPSVFSEITDPIRATADYIVRYRQRDKNQAKPSAIVKVGIYGEIHIIRS